MSSNKTIVDIYTDGACRGNGKAENIGGYGIVLKYGDTIKELRKAFRNTTNNIMELGSVIEALSALKRPCIVNLYTDSKYVVDAINQKWLDSWIKKGWRKANNDPVKNKELWQQLTQLIAIHDVRFNWVKGHADTEFNNRCDKLANIAMDNEEF